MRHSCLKALAALGSAGVLLVGATALSSAAPVFTNAAALKSSAASNVVDVRARRGAAVAAGIAAGAMIGAAIATRPYYGYYGYYDPGFYPYYGPGYNAMIGPVYAAAPPMGGPCFVRSDSSGLHGYWGSCAEADFQARINPGTEP